MTPPYLYTEKHPKSSVTTQLWSGSWWIYSEVYPGNTLDGSTVHHRWPCTNTFAPSFTPKGKVQSPTHLLSSFWDVGGTQSTPEEIHIDMLIQVTYLLEKPAKWTRFFFKFYLYERQSSTDFVNKTFLWVLSTLKYALTHTNL